MSHSKQALSETAEECRQLQEETAKKLREIATLLRQKQRRMNIAKISFHSASAVAGGLSIAGTVLAPFTGAVSLVLRVAGGGLGVAAGFGEIETTTAEIKAVGKLVADADEILNLLQVKMNELGEKLEAELQQTELTDEQIFKLGGQGKSLGKNAVDFGREFKRAVEVIRAFNNAGRVRITSICVAPSAAAVRGARAFAVGGLVAGIGLSVLDIVNDSVNIHQNVSHAADDIEKIAIALEEI